MSKNSNTEGKGFVLKMRFAMALVVNTVSDDSLFAFENNWLFRETLDIIKCCIYNLDGPIFITSNEIVDTMSERNKNLHAKYGIHGVT